MFKRIAQLATRYPKYVIGVWLAFFLLCLPFTSKVGEVLSSEIDPVPNSIARKVEVILEQSFYERGSFQIVLLSLQQIGSMPSSKLSEADFTSNYNSLIADIKALEVLSSITDFTSENNNLPLRSSKGDAITLLTIDTDDWNTAKKHAKAIQDILDRYNQKGQRYLLTGGAALDNEIQAIAQEDSRRGEIYGIPISLIILIIAFGAVVAATLPLIVALLSINTALALLFLLGHWMTFATYAQIIVSMLGLATGIDYALLMVNRFREELKSGKDPKKAAFYTTLSAGKAVFSSGMTVLIALAALLIPPTQFIRSVGIGGMVVILSSVMVSISFLPSLFCLLGHRVNWLKVSHQEPGTRTQRFWRLWAERILKRPWFWAALGMSILIVLSLPALNMRFAVTGIEGITEEATVRKAEKVLQDAGLDSLLKSYDLIIDFEERGFYHPSSVRAVAKFNRALAELPGLSQSLTPMSAAVPSLLLQQYYATETLAKTSPLAQLVSNTVSQGGRYVLAQVYPDSNLSLEALESFYQGLKTIGEELELSIYIGGPYVGEKEWTDAIRSSFPLAVVFVYVATFILLSFFFHSILIPLKSILLNTFTVSAAFGIITLVFQDGVGAEIFGLTGGIGFIESSIPIFIFAIVFGISMDYEVFLVARISEAHERGLSDAQAVSYALSRTGGVITSAASVMLVVFAAFLFSHIVFIKTLSLGLGVAVLLDATLVRLTLVPAMMILAGRWNWWFPKRLERLSRKLGLTHD